MHRRTKCMTRGFAVAFFGLISIGSCHGGISFYHEWSWAQPSDNGQYLFVSLFAEPIEEQIAAIRANNVGASAEAIDDQIKALRQLHKTYPSTGVYRNDGSRVPLWTIDAVVDVGKPSPDGRKVVSFYSTSWTLVMSVYSANSNERQIGDWQAAGSVSQMLCWVADWGSPYVDDFELDSTWDHLHLTWSNGATATVRLDDFAVVQSNTLRYAFFNLFTTAQGIVALILFTTFTAGVMYALVRWLMGGRTSGHEV